MPRIRSIKPEFWTSERLGTALPGPDGRQARLLFIALWNLAEDHGVCRGAPAYLRAAAFPYDEDVTGRDVERWLSMLEAGRFIVRYSADGSSLLWVRGFDEHQKIDRKSKTSLPEPSPAVRDALPSPRRTLVEPSLQEGKGREGSGKEQGGEGARVPREPPREEMDREPEDYMPPRSKPSTADADAFSGGGVALADDLAAGVDRVHREAKGTGYQLDSADMRASRHLLALAGNDVPEVLRRWANGLAAQYKQRVDTLAELAQRRKWEANAQPEDAGRKAAAPVGGSVGRGGAEGACSGSCGRGAETELHGHRLCYPCAGQAQQEVANFSPESVGAWVARRRAA